MSLNKSKGNMYDFINHTWNVIKGACPHNCSYCYMKRWGELNPIKFDEKELKTDLGKGNFIFVGSSCDMWADAIPDQWIELILNHCDKFENQYLFQTKNPGRILDFLDHPVIKNKSVICTTIETNRYDSKYMGETPDMWERACKMVKIVNAGIKTYVTIEPIMDFDLYVMLYLIGICYPEQVNIGADSGGNGLPEPDKGKIIRFIEKLKGITTIHSKRNLKRLLK